MPWYKNEKPSILGLSHKADGGPARTVQPGEVFEASADEIPEGWVKAGFIVDAKKPEQGKDGQPPPATAVPQIASEAAPTDKEVHEADEKKKKPSGFFK